MNSNRKNSPALTKGELRKGVKSVIAQIGTDERIRAALTVAERIESLPAFQSVRNIMLYSSLPDELPTDEMIRRWEASHRLFLPKVVGNEIVVACYETTALRRGKYGIMEPDNDNSIDPKVLNMIVVPGRAFDLSGRRVGRGGGYYDRFLQPLAALSADSRPLLVGVGFRCQMFDSLADVAEPHDIKMDVVISA